MTNKTKLYLGDFVLGAVDGTITTFAIVAGIVGAGLEEGVILALILGFANVLADGFSMGASNFLKAKSDWQYSSKGTAISASLSGIVTFIAFISVGSLPLLPFAFSLTVLELTDPDTLFLISAVITALCFICTGALRALVAGESYLRSIAETLIIGGVAAFLAYASGDLLAKVLR